MPKKTKTLVESLAHDLQGEFPGVAGFSASNLWRMRVFYGEYAEFEKLAPLVREVGWTHNMIIMEKCRDAQDWCGLLSNRKASAQGAGWRIAGTKRDREIADGFE